MPKTTLLLSFVMVLGAGLVTIPAFAQDYKTISGVGKDVGGGTVSYDVQYSSVKNIISSSVDTKDKSVSFTLDGNADAGSTLILKLPTGLINGPFIGVFEDGQIITSYTTTPEAGDTAISIPITPLTANVSIVGTGVYSQSIPMTSITVTTDKNAYLPGDSIVISGRSNSVSGIPLSIQVLDSSNNPVGVYQTNVNSDGTYSVTITTGGQMWNTSGTYYVQVQGGQSSTAKTTFSYSIESHTMPSKIPAWVRNDFVWYGQGTISEDDLLGAIKFLVDNGIIQLRSK